VDNKIEACPNGESPTSAGETKNGTTAHFDKKACESRPHREKRPVKEQVKENVVRFTNKSIEAAEQRKRIKRDIKSNTSHRAGIEGANAALKRRGLRKPAARGGVKRSVVCGLKAIAQNATRLIRYMRGGYDVFKKRKLALPRG
jgi:hypothetical protein